jgi:hypothetical protein
MHGNVNKGLEDKLPFQTMVGFFLHNCSRGVSKENRHLLIMDGDGFHITIQTLELTT